MRNLNDKFYVSVSQLNMAFVSRCERAWAIKYLYDEWEEEGDKSEIFAYGKEFHAAVEDYLIDGKIPLAEDCVKAPIVRALGLIRSGWLPEPFYNGVNYYVEKPLSTRSLDKRDDGMMSLAHSPVTHEFSLGGVDFKGFIDLYIPDPVEPRVIDFKTCKSPAYAKSTEDLWDNWQMLIYAYFALERQNWEPKSVRLEHMSVGKNKTWNRLDKQGKMKGLIHTVARLPAREVKRRVEEGILPKILKLKEHSDNFNPLRTSRYSFPGVFFRDWNRCNSFGTSCPGKVHCRNEPTNSNLVQKIIGGGMSAIHGSEPGVA